MKQRLSTIPQAGGEHRGHIDTETRQEFRGSMVAWFEAAVDLVASARERENCYAMLLGIDDPIFGYLSLGVSFALFFQVARAVFFPWADDFHDQVGSVGRFMRILDAMGADKNKIWF